jgi:hypothetical protein
LLSAHWQCFKLFILIRIKVCPLRPSL